MFRVVSIIHRHNVPSLRMYCMSIQVLRVYTLFGMMYGSKLAQCLVRRTVSGFLKVYLIKISRIEDFRLSDVGT